MQSAGLTGGSRPRVLVGLVGRHIGASRSPWLHEREGGAQGLDLQYTLFDFAALGREEADLASQIAEAQAAGYAGLNITYPYKQAVIAHLDALSPGASRVGAVNTVSFAGDRRTGHNTDVIGFAESVRSGLPDASLDRVLQFGAGGGGAATAQALLEMGAGRLFVADRDVERSDALVRKLKEEFGDERAESARDGAGIVEVVDGIVNATPMGMSGHAGSPVDTSRVSPAQWVADIVYFPLETELLHGARARGCRVLDGSGMAVYQAAAAFEIFTGRNADRARMKQSFREFKDG